MRFKIYTVFPFSYCEFFLTSNCNLQKLSGSGAPYFLFTAALCHTCSTALYCRGLERSNNLFSIVKRGVLAVCNRCANELLHAACQVHGSGVAFICVCASITMQRVNKKNPGSTALSPGVHEVREHAVVIFATGSNSQRNLLQATGQSSTAARKRVQARTCNLSSTATMES